MPIKHNTNNRLQIPNIIAGVIQRGKVTIHHDQFITPANFKIKNNMNNV